MKLKLLLPFAILLMLLTVAVCTGSQLFLLLSALVLLIVAGAFIAVFWAAATLEADGELSAETVRRGEDATLFLRMKHRGLIPIAPLLLELSDPAGNRDREIRLKNMPAPEFPPAHSRRPCRRFPGGPARLHGGGPAGPGPETGGAEADLL